MSPGGVKPMQRVVKIAQEGLKLVKKLDILIKGLKKMIK
jgi:hypothetical protein